MQFNVSQLLKEPIGAARDYDVDEAVAIDGEPRRLRGRVELVRTDLGVLARATLTGTAHIECSRCLAPIHQMERLVLEEEFIPEADPISSAVVADAGDPGALVIDSRRILDLTEVIRQTAVLEEPMWALCRPDCAGLCPTCGRNRNEEPCDCRPKGSDWRALEGLRRLQER